MLTRSRSLSLIDQLVSHYAGQIRASLLASGARLPSVRDCARRHGVSPSTVVAAYDQLLAQGLVEARQKQGFFVRTLPPPATAAVVPGTPAAVSPFIDAAALLRGMMPPPGRQPMPGAGVLPAAWLQNGFLSTAVRRVVNSPAFDELSLHYGEPKGDPLLRAALARRLAGYSIAAQPEQIITTLGATHGLDLVARTLLRPGDTVLADEPGWPLEFARLAAMGVRVLPVPRGPDGPDLAVMARYCETHQPKFYICVSVLHNPTGYLLPPAAAHRVLQLAQRHDFYIVEDDTYAHFAPAHATRMTALDGLVRSVYVSGFAKQLVPNWRIGYVAAPPELAERLTQTKLLNNLTTPALLERALSICLDQGQIRRHAERLRVRLDAARNRSVKLAREAGCRFLSEPAGMFGWVDTGIDADALAQRMLDQGWMLAPGSMFYAERKPSTAMRINFGTAQNVAFWQAYAAAMSAMPRG
ncbi:MAG: 2-aminoadipate transaminase [Paracidovorax wautersii]|uniref:2-aminoadipate transaminase n=1 Tax=Paracidovorax wautersii TaxID=1177982 RepID=A0A7V8FR12_9BURK|nr:MAG: 2-aminoadipate transaminase [Paracidovorax wautersii]